MTTLEKFRRAAGLTMKEVSVRLGLPYTTYIHYEKGERKPGAEVLRKMSVFYGVSVDQLIGVEATEALAVSKRRTEAELEPQAAAEALGLSMDEYLLIESGGLRATDDQLHRMAELFGCSYYDLADNARTAQRWGTKDTAWTKVFDALNEDGRALLLKQAQVLVDSGLFKA